MLLSCAKSQFVPSSVGILPRISNRPKQDRISQSWSVGCVVIDHRGDGTSMTPTTVFCVETQVCVLDRFSCRSSVRFDRFQMDRIATQPTQHDLFELPRDFYACFSKIWWIRRHDFRVDLCRMRGLKSCFIRQQEIDRCSQRINV